MTLLVLKVLAFVVSGYLLYRILRNELGEGLSVIIMVLYFIFPANVFALTYEFNIEAFAPVFLILVFDFFRRKRYGPFLISSYILCLIKENMFLVVFMFGLYALLTGQKERFKWAVVPMAVSAGLFAFLVFKVIPAFRDLPQHAFWVRYASLMQNPADFIAGSIPGIIAFIGELFGPYLLPVVLAPKSLFFILPVFLQHALSSNVAERSIYYHYALTMSPFIFIAVAYGFKRMADHLDKTRYQLIVAVIVVLAVGHSLLFFPQMKLSVLRHTDSLQKDRWDLIREIPDDAGVVATFDFLAPLSMRKHLYAFHKIYADSYQDPSKLRSVELYQKTVFRLPSDVQYALIDMNDTFLRINRTIDPADTSVRIESFLKDWDVVDQRSTIKLLKRKPALVPVSGAVLER